MKQTRLFSQNLNSRRCYLSQKFWILLGIISIFVVSHILNASKVKFYDCEETTDESITLEELMKQVKQRSSSSAMDVFEKYFAKNQPACAPFPNPFDLHYHNINYQIFKPTSPQLNAAIYLLNAYFDDRPKAGDATVRILSAINVIEPKFEIFCQMWFENEATAKITKMSKIDMAWNLNWFRPPQGDPVAFMLTCPLPKNEKRAPLAVSLANTECERATNNLKVLNDRPINGTKKKDFAVCVRDTNFLFNDASMDLIEFIEANFMFGVDKIVMYLFDVHPNMQKVLNYYVKNRNFQLIPHNYPGYVPNEPYLRYMLYYKKNIPQYEIIPYNDCFYRNMHLYKYIILMDIDELFVPIKGNNYKDMIDEMYKLDPNIPSTYYPTPKIFYKNENDKSTYDHLPKYLRNLQITTVATDFDLPTRNNIKSFFNTNDLYILDNHFPMSCLGACVQRAMPPEFAELHHFQDKCRHTINSNCKRNNYLTVNNTSFWKFKDAFIDATNVVVRKLNLL